MPTEETKRVLYEIIENIEDENFLLSVKEIVDSKYYSSMIPKVAEKANERNNRIQREDRKR